MATVCKWERVEGGKWRQFRTWEVLGAVNGAASQMGGVEGGKWRQLRKREGLGAANGDSFANGRVWGLQTATVSQMGGVGGCKWRQFRNGGLCGPTKEMISPFAGLRAAGRLAERRIRV